MKFFKKSVSLVLCLALALSSLSLHLAASGVEAVDLRPNRLAGNITYAENIRNINVHTAISDGYHFLLGASIIKFGDLWVCAYGQSLELENDSGTRFACRYSYDGCETWSDEVEIAGVEGEYAHSHGVLYNDGATLWAFCPKAKFVAGRSDFENFDFTMEAYTLCTDTMRWNFEGTVLDEGFWPLCEPIPLENGTLLIAGLECESGKANGAVAIASAEDPLHWEMVVIPNSNNIRIWGETTVINYGERLVAFTRTYTDYAAVSESTDYGRTWSTLALSDWEEVYSKMYGGVLSTGSKYLIYNYGTGSKRQTLAIAVGNPDGSYGFHNVYLIKNGFEKASVFGFAQQWAYPYAVEEDGYLYVVYTENKEDCELSVIPVSSLQYRATGVEAAESYKTACVDGTPGYETLAELADPADQVWWSGDGDGYENVSYTEIDGIPVVARRQKSAQIEQVLRRTFDLDLAGEDYGRLAFALTFWSAADFPASPSKTNRLFWGNCISASGNQLPLSSDYTIVKREDYRGAAGNLWSGITAGWNTWIIHFSTLAAESNLENVNTFFSIMIRNTDLADGDILYAIASLRIVRMNEGEAENTASSYDGLPLAQLRYQTLIDLADPADQVWWSGTGTQGTGYVQYTEIDGVPVVARLQSSAQKQVLRRTFDVDLSNENCDKLAFVMRFWSAADFSATPDSGNRLFWGDCVSVSGNNRPFSNDYTILSRIDYNASSTNLWSNVHAGWNTWIIRFGALALQDNIRPINTFFSELLRNTQVSDGEILYAIASLQIVRLKSAAPRHGVATTLDGKIRMGFFLDADWYGTADRVAISTPDDRGVFHTEEFPLNSLPATGEGRYQADVAVAAAQMTETLHLAILDQEGTPLYEKDYTVREYFNQLKTAVNTEKMNALCNATLAYGAAAQVYFNYRLDDLADSDYLTAVSQAELSTTTAIIAGARAAAGLSAATATATLESGVGLHFYFTPANPAESYTFTLNGAPITAVPVGGRYLVSIPDISAPELGRAYTVEVNGAYRVTYSVLCFVAKMQLNTDTKVVDLVNGMKLYYDAALNYFS